MPAIMQGIWDVDPNGYEKAIKARFSDAAYSIKGSSPYRDKISLRSVPLSIEEAMDAISEAIDQNRPYQPVIMPLALNYADLQTEARQRNMQSKSLIEGRVEAHQLAMGEDIPALFRGLRNMSGPINKNCRNRLLSFFNSPTMENWDDVARLIISSDMDITPWSIWTSLDPSAPRSLNKDGRWPKIPDKEMFIRILEAAASEPKQLVEAKQVTADDILKEKLAVENALRRSLGMDSLTDAEIDEAFLRTSEGGDREIEDCPSPGM